MTILVFTMIAFLVGALLGLYFKVYVLLPVIILSFATTVGFGFEYESSFGFILFLIFFGITALQLGYLCASAIGVYATSADERKHRSGLIETAQRIFRQSRT